MYNIFVKEKKEKEIEARQIKEKKEKEVEKKRKKKSKRLAENYENRIKNFLFEMAKNPVLIKDYTKPSSSQRDETSLDEKSKNRQFIYKGYQTEKERLQRYLNERKATEESLQRNENSRPKKPEREEITFLQPQMRFKARNTIERVFDVINQQNFGRVDRKLILSAFKNKLKKDEGYSNYTDYLEQQLPKYLIYNINKLKDEREKEEGDSGEFEDDETKFFIKTDNNFYDSKDGGERQSTVASTIYRNYMARNQSASLAMKLLNDYHVKTHFKGASNLLLNKPKKSDSPCLTNLNKDFPKMEFKKSEHTLKSCLEPKRNKLPTNTISINNEKITSIINDDLNKDIIKNFPLLYNVNSNNILKEKGSNDSELLIKLKKMSEKPTIHDENIDYKKKKKKVDFKNIFKNKESENSTTQKSNNPKTFLEAYNASFNYFEEEFKNKKDHDRILIDNKVYTKDQVYDMAEFILKRCNFLHDKNSKNDRFLKSGEGKTMITGGLTISEFTRKFNL